MTDYAQVVARFAQEGARLIQTDPKTRYETLGLSARNVLEPGWIPVRAPALLTTISYFPNESDLPSVEWTESRRSFKTWGDEGNTASYSKAYEDFLSMRSQIPFYRKWELELYQRLGLAEDETAWLPFFKLPMKQGTSPDVESIDAQRDLNALWEQLTLLRPEVILLQSSGVAKILTPRLPNLGFVKAVEVQKIPQRISNESKEADMDRIASALRPHIDRLRQTRDRHGIG